MTKQTKIETTEKVLHIRNSDAVPVTTAEKNILCEGVLSAPYDFLSKKLSHKLRRQRITIEGIFEEEELTYDLEQSTVYVDTQKGTLQLYLNEKRSYEDTITGQLTKYPLWDKFKVNSGEQFTPADLRKAMKRNRFFFENKEELEQALTKLFDFSAKVESRVTDRNRSGDYEIGFAAKVTQMEIPTTMNLTAPVYEGFEKHKVNIEVVADVSSGSVRFTLESGDLHELEESLKEKYLQAEISKLQKLSKNLAIVYKR